jgi:hypothetical protein
MPLLPSLAVLPAKMINFGGGFAARQKAHRISKAGLGAFHVCALTFTCSPSGSGSYLNQILSFLVLTVNVDQIRP